MKTYPSRLPDATWHRGYKLTIEIGLALSLLTVLVLFHLPLKPSSGMQYEVVEQETVTIEEISQTVQPPKPPPPPRALTPIAIPDEELPEDLDLNLDAALDLDQELPMPVGPPPPPIEEEEVDAIDDEEEIFVVVEEMPTIIGGVSKLYEILEYPPIARQAGIEGMVVVQFVVTPEGLPRDPVVTRSAGDVLDRAAVDAILQLRFEPGKQRGKAVPVKFSIPVRFRLEDRRM